MKRIAITGHKGYIGRELLKRGFLPLDCDVTDPASVQRSIKYTKPELVIHLAGKTSVEFCENKRNERDVLNINIRGTGNVFNSLTDARIPGIYLSSDHIFHGGLFEIHKETSKYTAPVNFYGMCKLVAEQAVRLSGSNIVRTSFLFDKQRLEGELMDLENGAKSYPTFIKRSFLHLYDFCDMLETYCNLFYRMPKLLHLSGSRTISWFTFMKEVAKQYDYKAPKARYFEDRTFSVPRPKNGGLNVELSHSLGFAYKDYIGGIERMKNES